MSMELKDIKPLTEIQEMSVIIYWSLVIFCISIIVFGSAVIIYKFIKIRKKDKMKAYLEKLYQIDFNDPKNAAYTITKYGRLLAVDDRRKELYAQILPMLDKYKYRKNVDPIDKDTKSHFELFRKICDESI